MLTVLERLGYVADASYPMYFYRKRFEPYHPAAGSWLEQGHMKILELPNFADVLEQRSRAELGLQEPHVGQRPALHTGARAIELRVGAVHRDDVLESRGEDLEERAKGRKKAAKKRSGVTISLLGMNATGNSSA